MRQLTLTAPRRLEWSEVPEPRIEAPEQAIVRPLAVAACDLDHPMVVGRVRLPLPIALGHEFVAEVVEIGDRVRGFSPGDRVVVPFQIACGDCDRCRAGAAHACRAAPSPSMYGFGRTGGGWGGALSDLVRVPFADRMLVTAPEGVEPTRIASASDNIPDAWRTVAPQLAEEPGASVLVVGGGLPSIGLYAVHIALALGAGGVTYLDDDPDRLARAEVLGATPVEGQPPRRHGSHAITVDASATEEGLACALRSTAPGGRCTSASPSVFFGEHTPIPLADMYVSGVDFTTGLAQPRAPLPRILELVSQRVLRPELVTSRIADWDDAPEALLQPEVKLVIARGSDAAQPTA